MTAVTFMGHTADPDELRALADSAAWSADWRERVLALPRYVLSRETLAQPPQHIAARLRGIAAFLERKRDGIPFGGPEFQDAISRLKAENERRRREHPEWFIRGRRT